MSRHFANCFISYLIAWLLTLSLLALFSVTQTNLSPVASALSIHSLNDSSSIQTKNNNNNLAEDTINKNPTTSDKKLPCVQYDTSNRRINVCGGAVNLSNIYSIVHSPSILNQTSNKNWFLNANITIGNKATLFINSTDTDWLKINSTAGVAYSIIARGNGNVVIDHARISSWNSSANNFTKLKSGTEPRAYLVVSGSGGQMNITNSNLSYLGYVTFNRAGGERGYTNGIAYYSGNGSIIKNNIISYNYRGFYSAGISNITIEKNRVFNNFEYGLDPHTGTSDLKVYSNVVNNNGDHGIICSQLCNHIMIVNNTVYNNKGHGIDLDLFVRDSTVSNNQAYGNNYSGVGIWASHGNLIKNNVLDNNSFGIVVTHGSYNNSIKDNLINRSKAYGIYMYANSTKNKFQVNTLLRSQGNQIYLQDNDTNGNIFVGNKIGSGLSNGIQFFNSSGNIFSKNDLSNNKGYNYYSKVNSTNIIRDTVFHDAKLRFFDNSSKYIIEQTDNKMTANDKKIPNLVYPTNVTVLLKPVNKNITLTTLDMVVIPSSNHTEISSFSKDFNSNQREKKWTEISPLPSTKTTYTIGGMIPNTPVMVNVNDSLWNVYTSNSSGHVSFVYDGEKNVRPFELVASSSPTIAILAILVLLVGAFSLLIIVIRKRKKHRARNIIK